jgi:hypothetical protein
MNRRRLAAVLVCVLAIAVGIWIASLYSDRTRSEIVVSNLNGETIPAVRIEFDDGSIIEFLDIEADISVSAWVRPGRPEHMLVTVRFLDGTLVLQNYGSNKDRMVGISWQFYINQWADRPIIGARKQIENKAAVK